MKTVFKIIVILFLCYLGFIAFLMYGAEKTPMLDFSTIKLNTLNDEPYSLNFDKPKVINIWATWCAPCIEEFPAFQSIFKKYNDEINFVMISDETQSKVQKWKLKNKYSFDFVTSETKFRTRPITYFLDKDGSIVAREIGGISEKKLENSVLKLLKK